MSENTIRNCFEKCGFGKPDVVADETVEHEFDELLQELCSDPTIQEFLEFDDCVGTCEPVVKTFSVYWRQELRAEWGQLKTLGTQLGYLFGYSKKTNLSRLLAMLLWLSIVKPINNRNCQKSLGFRVRNIVKTE